MMSNQSSVMNRTSFELPIDKHKRSILYSLEKHKVLIVAGETGSGKSTRIPQILFSAGIYNNSMGPSDKRCKQICITQPRRVAAVQLAQRLAQDLNCKLGTTVGYAVRFRDVSDREHTMIKFLTEGLLVRELMSDPLLSRYSVIIVDEVHERNLNTDILLGLLKCLLIKRDDLRLIVCSATLDIEELSLFFTLQDNDSRDNIIVEPATIWVSGKVFPIKIFHQNEPVANYLEASIETVMKIHESSRLATGKILVFLTAYDEVDYACSKLSDYSQTASNRLDLKKLIVLPLYASLRHDEISRVFETYPRNSRLCIVSTNLAETSLTIDDVAFVIDCGFTKLKIYNPKTGIDSLMKVPISKSSAYQRAGRAGRTRDGHVYRLYCEKEFDLLEEKPIPEIQRTSLSETVMLLKSLGVDDLTRFPLISPMPTENLVTALELLFALKAIDNKGHLTRKGHLMAKFNLDPKISAILFSPETSGCTLEACRIAAMLQVKDLYVKSGRNTSSIWSNSNLTNICAAEGDMQSYLNIVNEFINHGKSVRWAERRSLSYQALLNVVEISSKLEAQLQHCDLQITSCKGRTEPIERSLVSGLFSNAAYLHPSGDYRTVRGDQTVHIHPMSVFSEVVSRPKFVIFAEILNTTKCFMRHLMLIDQTWLIEAAPHFYTLSTNIELGTQ